MQSTEAAPTVSVLRDLTTKFFDLHWPSGTPRPAWSNPWSFESRPLDNGEKKGCYAAIIDDEVVYVGVGAGRGQGGIYEGFGIGSRTSRFWRKGENGGYEPTDDWKEVKALLTIGFDSHDYLAYALEVFLIKGFNPPLKRNSAHRQLVKAP